MKTIVSWTGPFALLAASACAAGAPRSDDERSGVAFATPGVSFGDALTGDSASAGAGCTGQSYASERLPLDLYFLIDLSGSMAQSAGSGSKWDRVSAALVAFLNAPESAGLGLGVGYFPANVQSTCGPGDPGCLCIPFVNICLPNIGGSCEAQEYATPSVSLSLSPDPAVIVADIQRQALEGGTPTRPALEGALQYVEGWAEQHPGRSVAVVLATDGDPQGCDSNAPSDAADTAAAAWNGPHRIRTFVIGVGNELRSLDLVAAAGGTGQAFLTSDGADLSGQFADALTQIRVEAGGCTYTLPPAPEGRAIDPTLVNVSVGGTSGAPSGIVPMASQGVAESCSATGGWYYDNPNAPAAIKLCPATCAALGQGQVDVQLGCQTVQSPR